MSKPIPLKDYKKIHQAMPIACVDIIIRQNDKYLLGKRTNQPAKNTWWFAGGRVHKGETLKNAAIRKVKEELGISLKSLKKIGVEDTIFKTGPFGWPTHTINIVYLADVKDNVNIVLDGQHSGWRWFSEAQANFPSYIKRFMVLAGQEII